MDVFPALVTLAALAAVYALVSGICATVADGKVRGLNSNQWMFRRVGFQAVAIALLLFAMVVVH
ncbi:MAG: HIG1 domain-containing protein [Burkholderiales bacterium]|nr:HIG1 domain-containing protein [Burkholderiales bacterium]